MVSMVRSNFWSASANASFSPHGNLPMRGVDDVLEISRTKIAIFHDVRTL